jgi:hypothetical protein
MNKSGFSLAARFKVPKWVYFSNYTCTSHKRLFSNKRIIEILLRNGGSLFAKYFEYFLCFNASLYVKC